jgi:hypothetical protein
MRFGKRAALGWAFLVVEGLMVARRHWGNVPPGSRDRARQLVAKSKGRPGNLSAQERKELVRIAREVDLRTLARDIGEMASPVRLPGRRRGRWH